MLDPGYYTEFDLANAGFGSLGTNVRIGRNSTLVGLKNIFLGSNIRIDGNVTFAVASGKVTIGSFVHIGGTSHLSGSGEISIGNFCTLSQGVRIYSASDDYSGETMTNPTTPKETRAEQRAPVVLKDHVILGSGTVVLPGAVLGTGSAVGALSLVKSDLDEWTIYAGAPVRKISARGRGLLDLNPATLLNDLP
jgi:acetyltransferase-like isoleucine patch superfamily enzyme